MNDVFKRKQIFYEVKIFIKKNILVKLFHYFIIITFFTMNPVIKIRGLF